MKLSSATRTTVVVVSLFGWSFIAHAAPNTSLYEASRACNGERDATDDQIIEGCSIVLQYGSAAFGGVKGAYVNRAFAYRSQGRCDLALTDFDKAITMRANKASIYRGRGSVYLCLKRYDEALADFNTAIEKDPTALGAISIAARRISPRVTACERKPIWTRPSNSTRAWRRGSPTRSVDDVRKA